MELDKAIICNALALVMLTFDPTQSRSALGVSERCIAEVRAWLACNSLKLNDTKTEFTELEPRRILPAQMSHPSPLVRKASRLHSKHRTLVLSLNLNLASSLTCPHYVIQCTNIYGALGRSGSTWTRGDSGRHSSSSHIDT